MPGVGQPVLPICFARWPKSVDSKRLRKKIEPHPAKCAYIMNQLYIDHQKKDYFHLTALKISQTCVQIIPFFLQSPKFATAFKNGEDHHNTIVLENYDFSREMKSFLRALYDGNIDLFHIYHMCLLIIPNANGIPPFFYNDRCQ